MKTAVIFGATGLVGSFLLRDLLDHPDYGQVIAFARRDLGIDHPKLKMRIGDFNTLAASNEPLQADEVFIALGSTVRKTPDKQEYYRIDHDYPVLAARRAQEGGATSAFVVSAVGANAASGTFYLRTKGEMERDILALGAKQTCIFRPSLIVGHRNETRPMESAAAVIWPALQPLLFGGLEKYRAMTAENIARALVSAANQKQSGGIYHWREMDALLHRP